MTVKFYDLRSKLYFQVSPVGIEEKEMNHFVIEEIENRSGLISLWAVVVKRSIDSENETCVGFIANLQLHLVFGCQQSPIPSVCDCKTPHTAMKWIQILKKKSAQINWNTNPFKASNQKDDQ